MIRRSALAMLVGCSLAIAVVVACDRTVDLTANPDATAGNDGLVNDGTLLDGDHLDGSGSPFEAGLDGGGAVDSGFPDGAVATDGGVVDGP